MVEDRLTEAEDPPQVVEAPHSEEGDHRQEVEDHHQEAEGLRSEVGDHRREVEVSRHSEEGCLEVGQQDHPTTPEELLPQEDLVGLEVQEALEVPEVPEEVGFPKQTASGTPSFSCQWPWSLRSSCRPYTMRFRNGTAQAPPSCNGSLPYKSLRAPEAMFPTS